MIAENLEAVRRQIRETAIRVGREPQEITLIAVSKTKPISMVEKAVCCQQTVFGENKVQELTDKQELHPELEWHLIGHLQRNKVKYIVDKVKLIHSVDSIRLAEQIQKEALKKSCHVDILLEVNVAMEETKSGFQYEEIEDACREIAGFSNVHIKGLMTIAPYVENPEENREYFQKLRHLFIDIQTKNIDNISMEILSMGMTNDYVVAVEEGATMVRVGTGIFGERDYSLGI